MSQIYKHLKLPFLLIFSLDQNFSKHSMKIIASTCWTHRMDSVGSKTMVVLRYWRISSACFPMSSSVVISSICDSVTSEVWRRLQNLSVTVRSRDTCQANILIRYWHFLLFFTHVNKQILKLWFNFITCKCHRCHIIISKTITFLLLYHKKLCIYWKLHLKTIK